MKDKFSVRHYLNHKIKPVAYERGEFYTLSIAIKVKGKETRIKSRLGEYLRIYAGQVERLTNADQDLIRLFNTGLFSERWLSIIKKEKKFPVFHLMSDEISVLKGVLKLRSDHKGKNGISDIGRMYGNCVKEITDVIDDFIKSTFREELKALFLKSIDSPDKKDIFRIVNYFIHFLDWNHPFYNLYDETSEMMPGELKKVESQLSKDLRLSVKAYTAFYTYINPLKRFFEKREQGRIATLSYLDWQSDIKELLIRQFGNMLGKKTALLYVNRLDEILNQYLAFEE
jgi:hypothetical protein